MRFFIALEIPSESKKQLEEVQDGLQELFPKARLTKSDKFHLTIAFVGEQPEELRDKLVEAMRNAVSGISPFEVAPAYIDGFPDLHHANVLWAGVKGDIDKLFIVRERIKDELVRLGLPVDGRRYVPHIALVKVDNFNLLPFQENKMEQLTTGEFHPIRITCIKLFESIPEEGFHKHNTLAEIPLQLSND